MIHARVILGIALAVTGAANAQARAAEEENPQIVGVWRGTSECTVKNGPCHDETNVYRISAVAGKPDRFKVSGSKLVDGKEVLMSPSWDWNYDRAKRTLTTAVGNGHFRLEVDGDRMEGELSLADGTVFRRIHLRRQGE